MGGVSPAQLKFAPEIASLVPRKREMERKGGREEGREGGWVGKRGGKGRREGGRVQVLAT